MAKALTAEKFLEWFPEFSGAPKPTVERAVLFNNSTYPERVWGEKWPLASALVTAHELYLRYDISAELEKLGMKDPGSFLSGTVAGMSASSNSLSQNFAVSQLLTGNDPEMAYWAQSRYGIDFWMMVLQLGVSGVVYSPDTSDTYGR